MATLRFATVVFLIVLAPVGTSGCRKTKQAAQTVPATTVPAPPRTVTPAPPAPPAGGTVIPGGGGGVMAGRNLAEKQRAGNDLRQIAQVYIQYELDMGRPPANAQEFINYIQRDAAKIARAIQDGWYIVYWNVRPSQLPSGSSNTVLAYDTDTPSQGGWVAMADGTAKRMTAQEFAAAPKAGR
jgi:hypothetical protein